MILNRFFPEDQADTKKIQQYIKAWVVVANESYTSFRKSIQKDTERGGGEDLPVIMGFVAGNKKGDTNTALERLYSYVHKHKSKKRQSFKIQDNW